MFGARDHFGIKPLYYAKMNGTFFVGSEIKAFLDHPNFKKELNKEALKPYMTFQYPVTQETFFKKSNTEGNVTKNMYDKIINQLQQE